MLEEEILELCGMADRIYDFLENNKDMDNREAIRKCPDIYRAMLFYNYGEQDKAEWIIQRVKERRINDERNRKQNASGRNCEQSNSRSGVQVQCIRTDYKFI